MSEAPENLFRTLAYNKATKRACIMVFPSMERAERDGASGAEITEYIRKDVSDALIATALSYVDEHINSTDYGRNYHEALTQYIRAFTPADTYAALDAMLKAEREKALREAAAIAGVKDRKGGKPVSGPHHAGLRDGRNEAKRLILALISEDKTDG